MKLTLVGSHLCPDTLYALQKLAEAGIQVSYKDILSCHADLRFYLNIREHDDLYKDVRGTDMLGVPLFILEDGTRTFDLDAVLAMK